MRAKKFSDLKVGDRFRWWGAHKNAPHVPIRFEKTGCRSHRIVVGLKGTPVVDGLGFTIEDGELWKLNKLVAHYRD